MANIEKVMDFGKCEQLFSAQRMSRYVAACGGNKPNAVEMYLTNLQLSQTFYPLLSILEVSLRNAIDRALSAHFSDDRWIMSKRSHFATHPGLVYKDKQNRIHPDHFFIEKIRNAERKIELRRTPLNHSKLLAELTFGFWVKFFDRKPIKILNGAPLHAFRNSPKLPLGAVHSHLNKVVALRNRISHNEPICFNRAGEICLTTIKTYQINISDALGWIDHELRAWSVEFNGVDPLIKRIEAIQSKPTA